MLGNERTKGTRTSLLLLAALCVGAGGCSDAADDAEGGPKDSGCSAWCESSCTELQTCGVQPAASCASDCVAGFGSVSCQGLVPPYQMECLDLAYIQSCPSHCAALCARAPECGPFDRTDCTNGCAEQFRQWHALPGPVGVLVCNPASVAARSCEQLSVEARHYVGIGRGMREGSGPGSTVPLFPGDSGLCDRDGYCSAESCSIATSTCGGPCASADDCSGYTVLTPVCTDGRCDHAPFP